MQTPFGVDFFCRIEMWIMWIMWISESSKTIFVEKNKKNDENSDAFKELNNN